NVAGKISEWLQRRASNIRRLVSICTGVYGLAYAGLLDGRRVSTHWRFVSRLSREFPKLRIEPEALFVKDGPFYTSAGIAAGIDLCLALIEEDYGPKLALDVARELVVYVKRPGDQNNTHNLCSSRFVRPIDFPRSSPGSPGIWAKTFLKKY